jgi:electron transfer flavoprotein alpha subunit
MAKTLLIAFDPVEARSLAGFGQRLSQPYDLLVLSGNGPTDAGAETVVNGSIEEGAGADGLADALKTRAERYTHIGFVSSMRSKDVGARLAGLLGGAMVTDAVDVVSPTMFKRPVLAGSAIATVEVLETPVVITVRPAGFTPVSGAGSSPVESATILAPSRAKRVSVNARGSSRPDLGQAKVVVSGGRPLKDADTFEKVIGGLADVLGGAVGATRAAVDAGIAPNELQVGQTGKIVAPDLYIAAGISGSTQHMAGIKDSKVIVAINKDPEAPIFQAADYGLVADLFDALPELQAKVKL